MSDVLDNEAEHRYGLEEDGVIAFAAYELRGGAVVFTHTIVPEEVGGRGLGSRLIEAALADIRSKDLKVVPLCSFVAGYFDRHPEQQDLLAADAPG